MKSEPSLSRRVVLQGGACLCGFSLGANRAESAGRRFCADINGGGGAADLILVGSYPGRAVAFFMEEEYRLTQIFFESSDRLFVDQNDSDAYFDPDHKYIALGATYLQRTANDAYGLLRIAGVLAHETGHSFQVAWGIEKMLSDVRGQKVKYVEIHADYLAGAYMAWREQHRAGAPAELRRMFFQLGDNRVESSRHHGNRPERFMAFARGHAEYQAAWHAKLSPPTVRTAAAMGLKYVLSNL